jgi:TatA/E family protein of Tat protein translocase
MLSIPHLIVIFIVALVIFGPEKIPELARNLGKVMAEFRRATGELRGTFEGHLRDLEREADQHRIAQAAAVRAAAPSSTEPQPVSPAPGTVPANPPNAGVLAEPASPGVAPREAAGPEPAPRNLTEVDPDLQGPSLFGIALDPTVGGPLEQAPQNEPAAEPNPEQVSDGRPSPA